MIFWIFQILAKMYPCVSCTGIRNYLIARSRLPIWANNLHALQGVCITYSIYAASSVRASTQFNWAYLKIYWCCIRHKSSSFAIEFSSSWFACPKYAGLLSWNLFYLLKLRFILLSLLSVNTSLIVFHDYSFIIIDSGQSFFPQDCVDDSCVSLSKKSWKRKACTHYY